MTDATSLTVERVFDATPEELWNALTDPAQYARWYGPSPDRPLVIHAFDVRVGGRIHFDMPVGDGSESYPTHGVFTAVDRNRRIAYGAQDGSWLLDVRIEPVAKGTKLVCIASGGPPELHTAEFRAMAARAWNSAFAKLDRLLAAKATRA